MGQSVEICLIPIGQDLSENTDRGKLLMVSSKTGVEAGMIWMWKIKQEFEYLKSETTWILDSSLLRLTHS